MAVSAPGPAVDPHFRQLESVSIGFSLGFECHPPPAEYRNFFGTAVFLDDDHGARKPCAGVCLFRVQLDSVAAIIPGSHLSNLSGLPGVAAERVADMLVCVPIRCLPCHRSVWCRVSPALRRRESRRRVFCQPRRPAADPCRRDWRLN